MSNLMPATWRGSVEQLRDNVMGLFDRWLPQRRREYGPATTQWQWPTALFAGGPNIDVYEDADAVRVTAELPGLDEKDFEVEVCEDRLLLHGERKANREEKKRNYYYSECTYGAFSRTIPLPAGLDAAKAEAEYKKGVLTVTLPKTEQAKAKRVKIEVK